MINEENKKTRKLFVKETIGTRKYFSYRADLLLYKIVLCIIVYLSIYIITSEFLISIIISLQVLLIFTLINKLNIERKEKEGREILLNKTKKDYFKKKLNNMDIASFEKLIKYFFEKQGYINYIKIERYLYLMNKSEESFYIKIFKLYEGAEIEKIDIRNFISAMNKNNIKNGFLVTTNEISEDANKLIDKLDKDLNLTIINADELFDYAKINKLLPDNQFFFSIINNEKTKNINKKIKIMKNNTINNKKIIIYVFAAFFFYILSIIMPYNSLSIYLCYYFIILTIVSAVYFVITKIQKDKVSE